MQNLVKLVAIAHPPEAQVVSRNIQVPNDNIKASRYTLPKSLKSSSPVGFRNRISLTEEERKTLPDDINPMETKFEVGRIV